jgi:predicted nucleic acid-binding protein
VIAVDTNVLVRLLTGDHPRQAARARRLFEAETIFVPKTVMLETEWVLRRLYGKGKEEIRAALLAVVALPNVRCEDEAALLDALDWSGKGMDFADAVHLASSRSADGFASFDADLAKRARSVGTTIAITAP